MTAPASQLQVELGVTPGVRDLVWEVFFASRGRGIGLDEHFPWLSDPNGVHCLWLKDDLSGGAVAAALVVRERKVSPNTVIGQVGLVCVQEARRGQGLSRHLMAEAVRLAHARGLSDLVLWTTKPQVYAKTGFVPESQDIFVRVQAPLEMAPLQISVIRSTASCNLPPFANAAWQWRSDSAQLTTLEGSGGVTLAAWQGEPRALLPLLCAAMPSQWCVNLSQTDPLLTHLERYGFRCATQPGAWQMRLHSSTHPAAEIPLIPLLERI